MQQPRYWPVWALTSGLATAVIVAVQELGLPALLGPIAGVLLTWAGRHVLIRPVGTDLAGSRLEIPLRLPGGVTLLVQRDRMLLKVPGGTGGAVPQALPLGGLALAQLGQFTCTEARFWPLPGARLRIWRGPVLRLVSGRQQWLIAVQSPSELAAIVRGRAAATPRRDTRALTLEQWHELRSWAAQQLTRSPRGGGFAQRTVGFRLVVALPAALLGTSLVSEGIGRGEAGLHSGAAVAGALLVIAMVSAAAGSGCAGGYVLRRTTRCRPAARTGVTCEVTTLRWMAGSHGGMALLRCRGIRCRARTPATLAAGSRRCRR